MAYTDYVTGYAGNYNVGKKILDEEITLSRYWATATDGALTAAAFYKFFSVPANFVLLEAYVICDTAETTSGTDDLDIVDDDSATTVFVNDANMTVNEVGATAARKKYAAAGFICVRPNHNLDTAAFTVIIKGLITNTSM